MPIFIPLELLGEFGGHLGFSESPPQILNRFKRHTLTGEIDCPVRQQAPWVGVHLKGEVGLLALRAFNHLQVPGDANEGHAHPPGIGRCARVVHLVRLNRDDLLPFVHGDLRPAYEIPVGDRPRCLNRAVIDIVLVVDRVQNARFNLVRHPFRMVLRV